MWRTLLCIAACLIWASLAPAFETGRWSGQNDDVGFYGDVAIAKKGNGYEASVEIFEIGERHSRSGICLMDTKAVEKGGELNVYNGEKIGFVIKKQGTALKVALMPQNGPFPYCQDKKPSFKANEVSDMTWKKER